MQEQSKKQLDVIMHTLVDMFIDDAYNEGYKKGTHDNTLEDDTIQRMLTNAYNKGLEEAWKYAVMIHNMSVGELQHIFGGVSYWAEDSVTEAIEKIKFWEKKKEIAWAARPCKTCKHSKDGHMQATEECHGCVYECAYEKKDESES